MQITEGMLFYVMSLESTERRTTKTPHILLFSAKSPKDNTPTNNPTTAFKREALYKTRQRTCMLLVMQAAVAGFPPLCAKKWLELETFFAAVLGSPPRRVPEQNHRLDAQQRKKQGSNLYPSLVGSSTHANSSGGQSNNGGGGEWHRGGHGPVGWCGVC